MSVHGSHCCSLHGCKYGDPDCPVVLGSESGIICEECDADRFERQEMVSKALYFLRSQHRLAIQNLWNK